MYSQETYLVFWKKIIVHSKWAEFLLLRNFFTSAFKPSHFTTHPLLTERYETHFNLLDRGENNANSARMLLE